MINNTRDCCSVFAILILLLCLSTIFPANSFAQDSFEDWKKEQLREFHEFRDERDREFHELLQQAWKEFDAFKPEPQYDEPKPSVQPGLDQPEVLIPSDEQPEVVIKKDALSPQFPGITEPFRLKQKTDPLPGGGAFRKGFLKTAIDFFDLPLELHYPESLNFTLSARDEEQISSAWGTLSSSDYQPVLDQLHSIREDVGLNDWGYILLLHRVGEHMYGSGSDESVLFTWFVMTKEGFITKAGYDQNGIYLLIASENQFFGTRYFSINSRRYYALNLNSRKVVPSSIFTYEGDYPDTGNVLDLNVYTTPRFQKSLMKKSFHFAYGDTTYNIPVHINRNVIAFYELYPLTEFDVYFTAPAAPETQSDLYTRLAQIIEGKSEREAVNILLRFVQTAFQYNTDRDQFGREKYFFPEETLYYPYSDCEDRAVLFARLVEDLLGLEVIGIKYPRHLATAVKFSHQSEGDYVVHRGEVYTVADPTYYNANIGMAMPQVVRYQPEIIVF